MKNKLNRIRHILDMLMFFALLCLMSYERIGQKTHEILGICMLALFTSHIVINRKRMTALLKGRLSGYRMVLIALDFLLLLIFLSQIVCGLAMSKQIFPDFPKAQSNAFVRTMHLFGAYWGSVIACLHVGMHWTGWIEKWKRSGKRQKTVSAMLLLCVMIYGAISYVRRGWFRYMTLSQQFVFFDFDEPLGILFLEQASIFIFWTGLGCVVGHGLLQINKRREMK